jgi:hypothetical protein
MRPADLSTGRGSILMRYVYLTLASCMVVLLLGAGILFMYGRAGYDLALPGATSIQLDGPALGVRQQQITYRLPPSHSLNDVYKHLESSGWSRDERAEAMMRQDSMDHDDTRRALTRRRLFGVLSEIAIVKASATDPRQVEVLIFRCVRVIAQLGCL